MRRNLYKVALAFFVLFLIVSCTKKTVEPIQYGTDYCHHCKMQIADKRYGGALLTNGGITHKYDSLECMHEDYKKISSDINEVYIVDFQTGELVEKSQITIYENKDMHGPMGTSLQGWKTKNNLPVILFEDINK